MSDPVNAPARPPRALLAEDDPVSRTFLEEALRSLGMQVCSCADGSEALALARREPFALLLLDCRLPGAGALTILGTLNADPGAASRHAPVLATSAEIDPALRRDLQAVGCHVLLAKPLQLADLERALDEVLGTVTRKLIDDRAGLDASGSTENLQALRGLFAQELDALVDELAALSRDPAVLRDRLHRLRASCGFCGASALAVACGQLGTAADAPYPQRSAALESFRRTLDATRQALGS